MKIYLDNCCFNRPFDNQASIRIKLETDAKLFIQHLIRDRKIKLAWSYMIDFENEANPFEERKTAIAKWKKIAATEIMETDVVLETAVDLHKEGLHAKDSLHLACAITAGCDFFLTTDDLILKKMKDKTAIVVLSPLDFITIIEKR